jgi:hypothetical protein
MAALLRDKGKAALEEILVQFFNAYLDSLDFENSVNLFHTLDGMDGSLLQTLRVDGMLIAVAWV